VGQLAVGHDVAGLGKGRHPTAVFQARVPADVIGVQMRAHDVIDVVYAEADGAKPLLETIAVEHVPERPRRPLFVIADAGVDQDIVVRRLDDEALNAEHQAIAVRIDESRLQPGTVFVEQFLAESGKKLEHVEPRPLLFDHGVNSDVSNFDRRRHCRASLRWNRSYAGKGSKRHRVAFRAPPRSFPPLLNIRS
jgi:hypothetical protein